MFTIRTILVTTVLTSLVGCTLIEDAGFDVGPYTERLEATVAKADAITEGTEVLPAGTATYQGNAIGGAIRPDESIVGFAGLMDLEADFDAGTLDGTVTGMGMVDLERAADLLNEEFLLSADTITDAVEGTGTFTISGTGIATTEDFAVNIDGAVTSEFGEVAMTGGLLGDFGGPLAEGVMLYGATDEALDVTLDGVAADGAFYGIAAQ